MQSVVALVALIAVIGSRGSCGFSGAMPEQAFWEFWDELEEPPPPQPHDGGGVQEKTPVTQAPEAEKKKSTTPRHPTSWISWIHEALQSIDAGASREQCLPAKVASVCTGVGTHALTLKACEGKKEIRQQLLVKSSVMAAKAEPLRSVCRQQPHNGFSYPERVTSFSLWAHV